MEITTVGQAANDRELWQDVFAEERYVIHDHHRGPMAVSAIQQIDDSYTLSYSGGSGGFRRKQVPSDQELRVFTVAEFTAALGMPPARLRQIAIDVWEALPSEMPVKRAAFYPPLIDALDEGTVELTYQGQRIINVRRDADDHWLLDTGHRHIPVHPDDLIQIRQR